MDLNIVFQGCNFSKTDGYRYVEVDTPSGEVQKLMESLELTFNDQRGEYQIPYLHPNAGHIVTFIDQKLGL
ncbi:MAG: hypothetical protein HRT94_06310 [Alphaproteobacteria bacterium]|nr:hypothetical protein [Alphaproteobacteria bacterium]